MIDASSHQAGKDPAEYYQHASSRAATRCSRRSRPASRRARPFRETDTLPADAARAEIPWTPESSCTRGWPCRRPACCWRWWGSRWAYLSRKAGKSAALVTTVFLAFLYYMGLISLIGLAKQGTLPVELAVWTPNAVLRRAGHRPAGQAGAARGPGPGRRMIRGLVRERLPAAAGDRGARASGHGESAQAGWASAASAAGPRHLHPVLLPALLRGLFLVELRADDRGLHLLRAAQRHRQEQDPDDARADLPVLPGAHADLRLHAGERDGGGAGHLRRADQAQRGDRLQELRRQPAPAGGPGAADQPVPQRSAVRVRLLLRARGQPQAGRHSRRDQGQARADLPASRPQVDLRPGSRASTTTSTSSLGRA